LTYLALTTPGMNPIFLQGLFKTMHLHRQNYTPQRCAMSVSDITK